MKLAYGLQGKTLAKYTILRFVDEFCYKMLIRTRFLNAKDYTENANATSAHRQIALTLAVRIASIREVHNLHTKQYRLQSSYYQNFNNTFQHVIILYASGLI